MCKGLGSIQALQKIQKEEETLGGGRVGRSRETERLEGPQ
jgi:hypothetical protein